MTCEVVRGDVDIEEEIPQEKAEVEGWSGGDTSVAPFPNWPVSIRQTNEKGHGQGLWE